jgi:hypothetical protein
MLVNIGAEFEPGTWKSTSGEVHTNYDKFKLIVVRMSIVKHTRPVQIRTALNREGVELPFNQSYQAEVTTNPLGKHYITS